MAGNATGSPITGLFLNESLDDYQSNYNLTNSTAASRTCVLYADSFAIKLIKTILYSILMLVAFVANMFIIVVVYKNKRMRRTTNIFIANMAASDMIFAILVIPTMIVGLHHGRQIWFISGLLGKITCKFYLFASEYSLFISIMSHAVIAFDRFWAIVYPLRPPPITPSRRKYIIGIMWLAGFGLRFPKLYSAKLETTKGTLSCKSDWSPFDTFEIKKTIYTASFSTLFLIPLMIMIILYASIVVSLIRSKNATATQTSQVKKQRKKEDIIVLRKVVILLSVFLISSLPVQIYIMILYYVWKGHIPCTPQARALYFTSFFIFLSNPAVNPCLCIFMYKTYRCKVKKLFPWKHIMNVSSLSASVNMLGGYANDDDVNNASNRRQTDKALELLPMTIFGIYFNRGCTSGNLP